MARKVKKSLFSYLPIPHFDLDSEIKRGIFIIFVLIIGCVSFLGMFNLAGYLGEVLNDFLTYLFAWGKWILPPSIIFWSYAMYNQERFYIKNSNYFGFFLFLVSVNVLFFLVFIDQKEWAMEVRLGAGGGHFGLFFAEMFVKFVGFISSLIISIGLLVISLLLMLDTTLIALFGPDSLVAKVLSPINFIFSRIFGFIKRKAGKDEEEQNDEDHEDENEEENNEEEEEENNEEEEENEDDENNEEEEEEQENEEEEEIKDEWVTAKNQIEKGEIDDMDDDFWWSNPTGVDINLPFGILANKKGKAQSGDIEYNKGVIEKTLANFKIKVDMGAVSVGPTVSQYTFRQADGIKLSKITSLNNDLALALAAKSIRIEAPIPGKSLVGIEVPNETKAIVGLKELLLSDNYKNRKDNLMLALGKDVSGNAWLANLGKMPHLLVAGTTNSGKSVCLNTIIVSLLYQNTPDNLRFIMVDPKRVELTSYNDIPHLLCPVIVDVNKTVNALKWCVNEMEDRLEILSQAGKKNIASYNETAEIKMPYIVFIIDELADLMSTIGKEAEGPIIRIAQKARAAGIHLILATQRPSVNVITGLIKANMPTRIAFAVASSMDSRTILDMSGAEHLIGQGDMLYSCAEISKPIRLQGAFLSDQEIDNIVEYVKRKGGKPKYLEGVIDEIKNAKGIAGMAGNSSDSLFGEAKELVINMGKASTTFLQRNFKIGYARAASLMDDLEKAGVIGELKGSKTREVLISKEEYGAMINQGVSGVSLHRRSETKAPDNYFEEEASHPVLVDVKKENNDSEEDFLDNIFEDNNEEKNEKDLESDTLVSSLQEDEEENEENDEDGKYFSK